MQNIDPEKEVTKKDDDLAVKRSYYYDDAHGYEVYDPEKETDEDDLDD